MECINIIIAILVSVKIITTKLDSILIIIPIYFTNVVLG
jgi:hypothetical protein